MNIYLASGNSHKLTEISAMLSTLPVKLHSAKELGGMPHADESAATLEGNAEIKANALLPLAPEGSWVLADDSGLFVDALDGLPGVRSARYAGESATDADNNAKLLDALSGIEKEGRKAAFKCVFCLTNGSVKHFFQGELKGEILEGLSGEHGFGYDPMFQPVGFDQTLAELGDAIKNTISHRANAVKALKAWLESCSSKM